jgi:ATP-dependent DNA ligase
MIVRRESLAVRLFTRRGYDWTERYPAIASAAAKLRARSFTIDGEAVVTGLDESRCSMRSTGGPVAASALSPFPGKYSQ